MTVEGHVLKLQTIVEDPLEFELVVNILTWPTLFHLTSMLFVQGEGVRVFFMPCASGRNLTSIILSDVLPEAGCIPRCFVLPQDVITAEIALQL